MLAIGVGGADAASEAGLPWEVLHPKLIGGPPDLQVAPLDVAQDVITTSAAS